MTLVNKISGGDTSWLEAILPPNYCLPLDDIKECCTPLLSAFYPHGYHTKVGAHLFDVVCSATRLPEGITL